MNWKNYFSTSIGKKLIVGGTGLFLITFLIVHCYVNAMIFWPDEGKHFTEAAAFMGGNVAVRIVEIGLFAGLIAHIVQGLMLWSQNSKRRTTRYEVSAGNKTSRWYSRSMGLLGTLILLFLILHLYHFWAPNRYGQFANVSLVGGANWEEEDLYHKMLLVFSEMWVVIVYVLGCFSLAWHLMHGFFSGFQTFGLATHKYKGIIRSIGVAFSILIPLIFAAMPVYLHMVASSTPH
jgi:succinate dehydrogenase / fumarate reductase cytochrome b subunit